ncbi:MAG: biotin transporter BioY [Spirochaetaceae bacterium]
MSSNSERNDKFLAERRTELAGAVRAALFVALITLGSYVLIPLPFSPVPIALQSGFVILAGLLLPVRWAVTSVGAYLLLGAVGLPIFSAGTGGLGHILGPTGGYLLGYLPAVMVTAILSGDSLRRNGFAGMIGSLLIYALGVPWLATVQGLSTLQAVSLGMLPFLPGDALKLVAATLLARSTRSLLERPASNP